MLPKRGAVQRDHAERVLAALQAGAWVGAGWRAKWDGGNFTFLGGLDVDDRRLDVSLKQLMPRPGPLGALRFCSPRRRSVRQWRGARRLHAIGVPAGRPILLARGRVGAAPCDWLLLESIPGSDLLRHLQRDDLSVREQHAAARGAGRIVSRIDSFGWFNRDTKLSNLIRTPEGEIVLVDTVDIQRRPGKRERMLRAMLYEAMGHDLLPRRSLQMRCLCEAVEEPKNAWRALEREAARQRDHTPRGVFRRQRLGNSAV